MTQQLIIWMSLMFFSNYVYGQQTRIYLIPGQGSDHRIYSEIDFPEGYDTIHIHYVMPDEGESMQHYASRLAQQIDDEEEFILMGVSLGGMLSSEIASITAPSKVIIISSAKCQFELPRRYTFQRSLPIYRLVGPRLSKIGAQVLQPIVEPDRKHNKETFKAMLKAKDPVFLKRSIAMIINWDRSECDQSIFHIHGTNDHTVPGKNVDADVIIENGSHMMTLTRAEDVNKAIEKILAL